MATLPRQVTSPATTYYHSTTRDNQLRTALESACQALGLASGIVSGGAVTKTAVFTVSLAISTKIICEGYVHTLAVAVEYTAAVPSDTVYVYATVTRTAAGAANPTVADTYALTITHNTTGISPGALYTPIAILTTDANEITAITEPALKYARPLSIAVFDPGRCATGHIRLAALPNDADTCTVTVAGVATVYEFESGGGVGGGNIAVTIGGTAAITATNLKNAILLNQAGLIGAAVHGTDTTIVDVRVFAAGATLALAESTAGARIVVQDNADELTPAILMPYLASRAVTDEEVTRGRVRFDTGFASVRSWQAIVRESAASLFSVSWNGAATVSGGIIELDNSGSEDWEAANVIDLLAYGT